RHQIEMAEQRGWINCHCSRSTLMINLHGSDNGARKLYSRRGSLTRERTSHSNETMTLPLDKNRIIFSGSCSPGGKIGHESWHVDGCLHDYGDRAACAGRRANWPARRVASWRITARWTASWRLASWWTASRRSRWPGRTWRSGRQCDRFFLERLQQE